MSTINFNDAIFAQEALNAFTAALTPLNAFSHDYNDEASKIGSAIYVPRVDALTATTFSQADNSGFPYENTGGTVNVITVTLDTQKIVTVDLTDLQAANSSVAKMITFARQQGGALGKLVLQTIWAQFTTVNFGVAALNIPIAGFGRTSAVSLRGVMAKRDVPVDKLSMIVNEDAFTYMLQDPSIFQAYAYGGAEAVRDGKIPKLGGLGVFDTNIMPSNSISLVGVASHPDGIGIAMRYLEPQEPGAYISAMRMVDPGSGIVMGYRRHYNPGRGKMFASFEALFGSAVGLSLGVGILTRTD